MLSISRMFTRAWLRTGAAAAVLALGIPLTASAETETVNRTVPLAAGGRVVVKNFSGTIEITGTTRPDVSVHAVRRAPKERLDRVKLDVSTENGAVTIDANHRTSEWRGNDAVETDLTIEVPREAVLDVTAFSSPVRVHDISGARQNIKTFSGSIDVEHAAGTLQAETFSGNISARPAALAAGDSMQLKTFSGDLDVALPPQASAAITFDSFSGDFQSDVPLLFRSKTGRSVRAELNPSPGSTQGTVLLKSFSGNARVLK